MSDDEGKVTEPVLCGQPMPEFPQGPMAEEMSIEDCRKEWEQMTLGDEKYKSFPRNVFIERRNKLFECGFKERIAQQETEKKAEAESWLAAENRRIAERDSNEAIVAARFELDRFFGGRERAEEAVATARSVLSEFASDADYKFLEESHLGNHGRMVEMLVNLSGRPDLQEIVRGIGLQKLVELGDVLLQTRKR